MPIAGGKTYLYQDAIEILLCRVKPTSVSRQPNCSSEADKPRCSMARESRGWEALCYAAAVENDPEKLQEIIVELNVLLDARQEELQRKRTADSHLPTNRFGRWHN